MKAPRAQLLLKWILSFFSFEHKYTYNNKKKTSNQDKWTKILLILLLFSFVQKYIEREKKKCVVDRYMLERWVWISTWCLNQFQTKPTSIYNIFICFISVTHLRNVFSCKSKFGFFFLVWKKDDIKSSSKRQPCQSKYIRHWFVLEDSSAQFNP